MIDALTGLPMIPRIVAILAVAVAAHLLVKVIRWAAEWLLRPAGVDRPSFLRMRPKVATIGSLIVSALAFAIYFSALGFVLGEFGVPLTTYFASATIIGLAVGFGSQGMVQDVVTGLTMIVSDVLTVGDVADVGGQTGRVDRIGLRFTVMVNFLGQTVFIPNRNIGQINRYQDGVVRAYVDVQIPEPQIEEDVPTPDPAEYEAGVVKELERLARGFRSQHPAVVRVAPRLFPVRRTSGGGWRYVRIELQIWPGQGPLVENTLRQRMIAAMRRRRPDYADWMVTVTYRIEVADQPASAWPPRPPADKQASAQR